MGHSGDQPGPRTKFGPFRGRTLRAVKRGRLLQLGVIAGSILVLAVVAYVSITALRGHADSARQVQILIADVRANTEQVSRLEWEASAGGRPNRELHNEFQLVRQQVDGLLHEYNGDDPQDAHGLYAEARGYLAGVERRFALLDAGRVAESKQLDERVIDPTFTRLLGRLELIDAAEGRQAETAASWADRGIAVSLLLVALALIVVLRRLDTVRGRAARKREQALEVQAMQDVLTNLPNRRKLLLDLQQELLRNSGGRCVLVLCDLDGFKDYNDTFGHPEGDLLLVRLSERLARSVAPHGTAYRLGGDEFCALLRIDQGELEPALAACRAALCEGGSGFDVRASIGSVALPEEASDSSTALRLADQRMYAQKNERESSVKHQLRDLVLRLIVEQDPELHGHVQDVGRLAGGVGRRLDLNHAEVANLVRAAELHDVGKIAIPDSILHKPGPLDPDEQEFMQRHTLIGESILGAAPALAGAGGLVRSSHERYDGAGYPDGLREEEIPLSSRIIFVCDSFQAMTTDRPYRQAMSEDDALVELRRCAGTQFDPAVVDAFAAELAALESASEHPDEEPRTPEPALLA
jgi:diguanylate cyclase (GGDEF)-like protein